MRRRSRQRRWRRDAKRSAELIREFVYLDEVSVFSLLASKDGMIASEVTDSHASTIMSETSGSVSASGGIAGASASAKSQTSDTRTTQVLRKAIIQSTFRDLYARVLDSLAIVPASEDDKPPVISSVADLEPDGSRVWVLDPAALRRGDLIELTVELEAEPLFQARSVVSTFLDIVEKDRAMLGIENAMELAEAAALSRMIEKLGAGFVPLRARARDYAIITLPDEREMIVHRELVAHIEPSAKPTPMYLVGVAEEALFWKDIRSVVFARSEFQVLARVLRPDLQGSWTPLKLVDVLGRIAPQLHEALAVANSGVLEAMAQGAAAPKETGDQVRLVLHEYADLLADSLGTELDPHDAALALLLEPPDELRPGSSVKQWRAAMEPIAGHIASVTGTEPDRQTAARLRVLAQMKHGLGPIGAPRKPDGPTEPGVINADGRLLDTEIIAIYW